MLAEDWLAKGHQQITFGLRITGLFFQNYSRLDQTSKVNCLE